MKRYWFIPILLVQLCLGIYACGSDAVGQDYETVIIYDASGRYPVMAMGEVHVTGYSADLGIWFEDDYGNETVVRGLPHKVECVGECPR